MKRLLTVKLLETYDRLDALKRLTEENFPYIIKINCYDEEKSFIGDIIIENEKNIKDILDLLIIKTSKREKDIRKELAEDLGEKDN